MAKSYNLTRLGCGSMGTHDIAGLFSITFWMLEIFHCWIRTGEGRATSSVCLALRGLLYVVLLPPPPIPRGGMRVK